MAEDQNKELLEEETEEDFITLEFDDGTVVECFITGVFDLNGKEYYILSAGFIGALHGGKRFGVDGSVKKPKL